MTKLAPIHDLDAFVRTRTTWHVLAEHVLAPARRRADGHIGLRAIDGGVGTPPSSADATQLVISGTEVRLRRDGRVVRREPITTAGAAADLAGIEPGADPALYTPSTTFEPDAPLFVADDAAVILGAWFAFAADVLDAWRTEHADAPGATPSAVQLWPEHFDLAVDLGDDAVQRRANYGGSPGDGAIAEPYLYVGPWATDRIAVGDDGFWNQPWGAALRYSELAATPDPTAFARAFLAHGELRLAG